MPYVNVFRMTVSANVRFKWADPVFTLPLLGLIEAFHSPCC